MCNPCPNCIPYNVSKWVGIYVGFDSPSIIRYFEPLTGDVFTVRFADCHFNESVFPPLGGEKSVLKEREEITCNSSTMSHFDHCTNQCELEVQRIIHLQNIANQLLDAFIDTKKVTKSHISAANAPTWINVPEGQLAKEYKIRLKRRRPIFSKDIIPEKRRTQMRIDTPEEVHDKQKAPLEAFDKQKAPVEIFGEQEALAKTYIEQKTPEEVQNKELALKEAQVLENYDISINYVHTREN